MAELADGQPLYPGESDIDQLFTIQKVFRIYHIFFIAAIVKYARLFYYYF